MIKTWNLVAATALSAIALSSVSVAGGHGATSTETNIQLGSRPYYLVEQMDDSALKSELQKCANGPFKKSDFSIGHRGAPMQFPEHTKESYEAAARMGAGIIECDVTFTKDKELVCRHSQCDLHTTTNILAIPALAAKCTKPFTPAVYDEKTGEMLSPASAQCCASDLTVAEFKTLRGKMDASDKTAKTAEAYMGGTADWRTDLYAGTGTLLTHAESIELFKKLGTKMTPELKSANVTMPFDGYTQADYAQQMINEYKAAGVDAADVFPQSFNLNDVLYWIGKEPAFGQQAVYLDDEVYKHHPTSGLDVNGGYKQQIAKMPELKKQGVNYMAPPMWALIELNDKQQIVPSAYAKAAKANNIDLITWTLERSGLLKNGGGWYYQTTSKALKNEGDMMEVLDVLAQDVGIKGMFSDWPATTTYYANCKGL